jgi:hypothetical protein
MSAGEAIDEVRQMADRNPLRLVPMTEISFAILKLFEENKFSNLERKITLMMVTDFIDDQRAKMLNGKD